MKVRLAILGMMGVLGFALAPAFAEGPEVGDKAPEVAASEWFNLPSGVKSLKQSHLDGQIVIVEFWATWCGPCKASMPHLTEIHEKFRSRGVVLVALSDEPDPTVEEFIKKNKMPYIIGSGARATKTSYGVDGIPASFLIAPDGKLAWKGHPAAIDSELEKLLKESPPKQKGILAEKSADGALKKAKKLYD